MKCQRFIFIFFFFSFCQTEAQDSIAGVFHLHQIPVRGLPLKMGWKFSAGDNAQWASPDYNDKAWMPVDPTGELHDLPSVRNAGIGWFRLNMLVDSQMFGKTVALVISIHGATEIYHNGKLIHQFGNVNANYKEEKTSYFSNKILGLKLANQSSQLFAIRYSFNKKNLYLKFSNARPLVRIILKDIEQALEDHKKEDSFDSTLRSIEVSFYLPLGFLLLFLFYSFRPQREYLYAGIFCFCMFAAIFIHIFALSENVTVSRSNILLLITQIFYIIGAFSLIKSLNILYNQKRSWFYYFIIIYGIFSIPFFFISYDSSGIFNALFFPLINIEFLRLNYLAVRRKRKGAWILLITGLFLNFSLLFMVWFNIIKDSEASALLQSISYIFPGIGLSLFYASEFARNAADLRFRAREVEELSHEMITREKEKQQILESQNETLEKQVTERTAALNQSLIDLEETQNQLFQREKMASLGELTAGIAHEIQNPLNFVNNFSEVNTELIDEMEQEISKGNTENIKSIAADIKQNFEKINQHGKRAEAIVKGMLQHSRSSGSKELTDLNVLIDEYSRLAYHGLRAKDKSFNASMKTEFDKNIGKISIAPHDIGRVLLNLVTNAFYAVTERKAHGDKNYEPAVFVSTKRFDDKIEIKVKDNGNGIPQKIVDKIFQPFFTTKPTGQGTGLGLSISYDIINSQGGELSVKTKEGEGSEFTIQLFNQP